MNKYEIEEQEYFKDEKKQALKSLNLDFEKSPKEIKFLGLDPYSFSVKYYIGIDWLKERESYIVVHPKIENLDYIAMFLHCLKHRDIQCYTKEIYHFNFKLTKINTDIKIWDFNLFLLVHFLSVVERITKQGLKKNYIQIEENINGKIKGKLIWSQQIKKNIASKREDRAYCRYQEYSVNCLENRLLKRTLLMVERYLKHFDKLQINPILAKTNQLLHFFEPVSDSISIAEMKRIKVNSLYKEYVEAIELAKQIMQRFGYSVSKAEREIKEDVSPFWIDMSKLFELYVFSLLKDEYGKEIRYQPHGTYGNVDFLKIDEKLIIDTKYKKCYDAQKEKYNIDDIRQLSAYARDEGVLKKINVFKEGTNDIDDEKVIDCVIIYPDNSKPDNFIDRKLKEKKIDGFTKFYTCGIKMPRAQGIA